MSYSPAERAREREWWQFCDNLTTELANTTYIGCLWLVTGNRGADAQKGTSKQFYVVFFFSVLETLPLFCKNLICSISFLTYSDDGKKPPEYLLCPSLALEFRERKQRNFFVLNQVPERVTDMVFTLSHEIWIARMVSSLETSQLYWWMYFWLSSMSTLCTLLYNSHATGHLTQPESCGWIFMDYVTSCWYYWAHYACYPRISTNLLFPLHLSLDICNKSPFPWWKWRWVRKQCIEHVYFRSCVIDVWLYLFLCTLPNLLHLACVEDYPAKCFLINVLYKCKAHIWFKMYLHSVCINTIHWSEGGNGPDVQAAMW